MLRANITRSRIDAADSKAKSYSTVTDLARLRG